MNDMEDRDSDGVEHTVELQPGCIPIRSIEIVQFLDPEGQEGIASRWQGTPNIVVELGMIDYARLILSMDRLGVIAEAEETDDKSD